MTQFFDISYANFDKIQLRKYKTLHLFYGYLDWSHLPVQ